MRRAFSAGCLPQHASITNLVVCTLEKSFSLFATCYNVVDLPKQLPQLVDWLARIYDRVRSYGSPLVDGKLSAAVDKILFLLQTSFKIAQLDSGEWGESTIVPLNTFNAVHREMFKKIIVHFYCAKCELTETIHIQHRGITKYYIGLVCKHIATNDNHGPRMSIVFSSCQLRCGLLLRSYRGET